MHGTDRAGGPAALQDSAHLLRAEGARRRTSWWLALVVTLAIFVIGTLAGVVRIQPSEGASVLTAALLFLPVLVVAYGLRILLVWLWVARYEGRPFRSLGFPRGEARLAVRGVLVGLAVLGAMVGLVAVLGGVSGRSAPPGTVGLSVLLPVLVVFAGWAVQSSTEEILYRGFALQALGRSRVWVGIVVTSVIFVLVHQRALGDPLAALNLFLAGVMFALYVLREGGLWGACGLHAVFNWGQHSLFGFPVSGQEVPGGSLLALQTSGSSLLTGGEFGIEASLPGTVVLLAVIVVLLRVRNRQPGVAPSTRVRAIG